MADLIAQGSESEQRWRRPLAEQDRFTIGRVAGSWSTAWDDRISRLHAALSWREGQLEVSMLAEARNPIYFRGRKANHFTLQPGEYFVIGGTTFSLVEEQVKLTLDLPRPVTEQNRKMSRVAGYRVVITDQS